MSRTLSACLLAATAALPAAAVAQVCLPQPLLSGTGSGGQLLGRSVATDGVTIAIGSPSLSGWPSKGRVLVHEQVGSAWTQVLAWTPAGVTAASEFGISVDVEGDVLVAGAPKLGAGGRAFVLERSGGAWAQAAVLLPPEGEGSPRFGAAVAVSGGRLLVTHEGAGDAHVFEKVSGAWTAVAVLQPSVAAPGAEFGRSASLGGDRAVIGAPFEDAPLDQSGAAYVFAFDGAAWTETARLVSPAPAVEGFFGLSLDLQGERLALGEPRGGGGARPGVVHPFSEVNGAWQPQPVQQEPAPSTNGNFGYGVALDGARLLAGAIGWSLDSPGRTHLFEDTGAGYAHVLEYHGPGGFSGDSAGSANALAGDLAVQGRFHNEGAFHVLDLADGTWQDLGSAHPGFDGPPRLYGFGTLLAGSPVSLELEEAQAFGPAVLFVALGDPAPLAWKGGTLQAAPFVLAVVLVPSLQGQLKLPFTMLPGLEGQDLVLQFAVVDAAASAGVALSNAIVGHVP